MLEGVITDLKNEVVKAMFSGKHEEEMKKLATEGKVIEKAKWLSAFLGEKDFLLGEITLADIYATCFLTMCSIFMRSSGAEDVILSHENLKQLCMRVKALPGIAERVQSEDYKKPWYPPSRTPFDEVPEDI